MNNTSDAPSNLEPRGDNALPTPGLFSLLMILAAMSVITARLVDAPALRSANDRSRWCTVWSLVEKNTYQIDEIRQRRGWDTIDLVRHEDHFYSSKPPLLPRLVAELYRVIKLCTGWTLTDHTEVITRIILFLINIVPMGLALWVFSRLVARHCRDGYGQLYAVACACWGTMLLPYLTVFNNHTVAATAFFFALALLIGIVVEEDRQRWRFAACGLCSAFGVCNELPAALFGLAAFVLCLRASRRQTLSWFLPAALLPLAAFFITNYQATGGWKPFYASYGTSTYEFVYEGVPSYWTDPKGIDKPRDSLPVYLWHCTLGHHGIFSLSPIYLITLATWCFPFWITRSKLRLFHVLSLLLSLVTLGFYLSKTANYNYSGVSVALRWMLWLTPFWLLSLLPMLNRFGRRVWFRALSAVLLCISVFSAWYPANAPWAKNWIFQWMEAAKWINYSDPAPVFSQTHYTWLGRLPQGELQPDYWISFVSPTADGLLEEIRLADAGPVDGSLRQVEVRRSLNGRETAAAVYVLDPEKFSAGQPVEEFLVRRQDGAAITEEDLRFFRGMPRRMQYVSSRIRYEKTALRRDAFRCHVGYTYVTEPATDGRSRQVIRDVWYCSEVPFGVLQWEDRVQDGSTHELLTRRSWQPQAVGKFFPLEPAPAF